MDSDRRARRQVKVPAEEQCERGPRQEASGGGPLSSALVFGLLRDAGDGSVMQLSEPPVALHRLQRRVNRASHTVLSHLRSIVEDSQTVSDLRSSLPSSIPCILNKRNGCWYVDSSKEGAHCCYFKSTDGHDRNLLFNTSTRMNLHVALQASEHGAALIVDSTRRGKNFPDALRTTIPLWCAVINKVLGLVGEGSAFTAPAWLMTPQLIGHISNEVIPQIVSLLSAEVAQTIVSQIGHVVKKRLVPVWLHPDEDGVLEWKGEHAEEVADAIVGASAMSDALSFTPLLLLSCSGEKKARHVSEQSWEYIQGAGDDEENWACGLRPDDFWANKDCILSSDDPVEVEREVRRITALSPAGGGLRLPFQIALNGVVIGVLESPGHWDAEFHITCNDTTSDASACSHLVCISKSGSIEKEISSVVRVFESMRKKNGTKAPRFLVTCHSGSSTDHAITVVLVLVLAAGQRVYSKDEIRRTAATLQSLLPAYQAWHPSKEVLKQMQRFFSC